MIRALVRSEPHHERCRDFLIELAELRATVVFNRLLELELAQGLFRGGLRELHPDRASLDKAWGDGRCRRRARRRMNDALQAWRDALELLDWVRIELHDVADEVPVLMATHGLHSYDACHVATAIFAGVDSIVTLDKGFARVPASIARLLVDPASVKDFRRIRGGRQRVG